MKLTVAFDYGQFIESRFWEEKSELFVQALLARPYLQFLPRAHADLGVNAADTAGYRQCGDTHRRTE